MEQLGKRLTLQGTTNIFSQSLKPFYTPPVSGNPVIPHHYPHLVVLVTLILAILVGVLSILVVYLSMFSLIFF